MAVEIVKCERVHFPALRFIGRRYTGRDDWGQKWGEWWREDLFSPLEKLGAAPENGDAYCAIKRVEQGEIVYWIGMLFPAGTQVPEGYEAADMPAAEYALLWLRGEENSAELTSFKTHEMCLRALAENGLRRKEDDWCLEKYQCPRYTMPDEQGRVILDYGIMIE